MVFLHVNCCILKEEQRPYVFWVCFSPHDSKGEMCRHRTACEHVACPAAPSTKEELPGSSPPAPLLSLSSFPGSLSAALEGSLASSELSKLCMTARHTKQLLLPAPLKGWLPTPNSSSVPTLWCLHGGRAGSTGARAQPGPTLPLHHYGQREGQHGFGTKLFAWLQNELLRSASQWLGIYLESKQIAYSPLPPLN